MVLCCVLLRVLWCVVACVVVCCALCCVVVCCCVVVMWSAATLMRVMVTPAVCPRLFEFLTALPLGALRKNHFVSTEFETITKKKARRPRAVSMNRQEHNRSLERDVA